MYRGEYGTDGTLSDHFVGVTNMINKVWPFKGKSLSRGERESLFNGGTMFARRSATKLTSLLKVGATMNLFCRGCDQEALHKVTKEIKKGKY